jgi:hypothetical protein
MYHLSPYRKFKNLFVLLNILVLILHLISCTQDDENRMMDQSIASQQDQNTYQKDQSHHTRSDQNLVDQAQVSDQFQVYDQSQVSDQRQVYDQSQNSDQQINDQQLIDTSTCAPSPLVSRLLTRYEYDYAILDLFGLPLNLASRLPQESSALGFDASEANQITPILLEAYQTMANQISQAVIDQGLDRFVPCASDFQNLLQLDISIETSAKTCAIQLISQVAKQAFRRNINIQEILKFSQLYETAINAQESWKNAVAWMIEAVLNSPHFLYLMETSQLADLPIGGNEPQDLSNDRKVILTPKSLVSQLSFVLWASVPDETLIDLAESHRLEQPEILDAQIQRMLSSPKINRVLDYFHSKWLNLDKIKLLERPLTDYPDGQQALRDDLMASLQIFIHEKLLAPGASLHTFLNDGDLYLTQPLANMLGLDINQAQLIESSATLDRPLYRFSQENQIRAGVLTQPALLSLLSHPNQTSPVQRGVFLRTHFLCQEIPPPPPNLMVTAPDPSPELTTRQRFAEHSANPACAGCHRLIDSVGFIFEGFDENAKRRLMDGRFPVDESGEILSPPDPSLAGSILNPKNLAEKLAQSTSVSQCLSSWWIRYALARRSTDADACVLQTLSRSLEQNLPFSTFLSTLVSSPDRLSRPRILVDSILDPWPTFSEALANQASMQNQP